MGEFVAAAIGGLAIGCIYGMLASAYALIFKVSKTLNLAVGAMLLLGGYLAVSLMNGDLLSSNFALAVSLSCVALAAVGAIVCRLVGWPLIGAHADALVIATIGVDLVLRTLLSVRDEWSVNVLDVNAPWGKSVDVAGRSVAVSDLVIVGVGAAVALALGVIFRFTNAGLSMRACAEDGEVALAQGISIRKHVLLAWILAAVIAAVVGILVGAFPRSLDQGNFTWAYRALPAAVLGGMGSIRGAFIGGIIIGYVEILTLLYQPAALGTGFYLVSPFIVMLFVLLVRPQGIFGQRKVSRA